MSSSVKNQTAEVVTLPTSLRERNIKVVKKVKGTVTTKMSYLFEGLMNNVVDALFEDMQIDELSTDEQEKSLEQHFNITRALKTRGATYKDEFFGLMNASWVNLVKAKNEQPVPDPEKEVADMLKTFSDKNLNHYKILLEELRVRFSSLVQAELDYHPMLPGNFYLCFWYATEKLELSLVERKLLLPLFNRFVMDRFGQVLSISNQCLVEFGVESPAQKAG